jgi:hypothetical protein
VFGDKERGISGEERLGEVDSVSVEVMRVAAGSTLPDGQREGDGVLGG